MRRAEFEWAEVPYPVSLPGQSDATPIERDDHAPHSYLYLPDKSSDTGWSAHRVPERNEARADRRPMGFRR